MRKYETETIKRVVEEGKDFKTAKKKFSKSRFHLTGILEAMAKAPPTETGLWSK